MIGQWGPEHVGVCVLKHYCDCNVVCALLLLDTSTIKGASQHHTSLSVTDKIHALTCGCYVRVCMRACMYVPAYIKVNFTLEQATMTQSRAEVQLYSFFNLGARWGGWSTPRPGRFTPGKYPRPIVEEGPRAGLDGYGTSRPHRDSIPGPSLYRLGYPRPPYVRKYLWNTARYHTG